MISAKSPLADVSGMSARLLRTRHADAFGIFAGSLAQPFRSPRIADPDLALEWARLVAEELLLAHVCGLEIHPSWTDTLADVTPFAGNKETTAYIWDRVIWVATVPVIRPDRASGSLIRVWGLTGADDAAWVTGHSAVSSGSALTIRLGGWDREITGYSWQLGAALAMRAAHESRADLQLAMARDWVMTGEVAGERVERVQVGNKTNIRTTRRWLVPAACNQEFLPLIGRLQTCATMDAAWSQLSGEGTLEHGMVSWTEPGDVVEMHATVSKAVRPVIASVMITCPARLLLWHSANEKESALYADLIEAFFEDGRVRAWPGWRGHPPAVTKRLLPDSDLVAGEKALRGELLHQAIAGTILFNITCGNLVMKLAAYNIARLNPSIWLIYREPGIDDPMEVILIRNAGHLPSTGRMSPKVLPDGLQGSFFKDQNTIQSVEELVAGIFVSHQPISGAPSHAVTHPGPYHADDVVAGAILRLLYGERFPILRTADRGKIAAADLVFDVGGEWDPQRGRFDHHQGPTQCHPCGTPCASAGLLWSAYGKAVVGKQCPGARESEVESIAEVICQLCIRPVDAWDNGIFPDFRGQRVLPFQTVLNASASGGDPDKGYEIAVSLAMRMLAGFIGQRADAIRRESALTAVMAGSVSEPALVGDRRGACWLLSRSLRFPLRETCDFLAPKGIALRGVIQPNFAGREGKWMILSNEPIPCIPEECFRSQNQLLVILPDIVPALASLELDINEGWLDSLD